MDELEAKAVGLVAQEKTTWETGTAFITERVAFQMRNLIRQCRKNYYGVFDEQVDPITNRKKIWVPLTESMVESVVKNIDLDTKDINFRAKNPDAVGLTSVVRNVTKHELDRINFGEMLDVSLRSLAIDGTTVWHTGKKKDENGKMVADVRIVDLLNFYIDPTASSIQEAEAVIERILVPEDEFKRLAKQNKWVNVSKVKGTTQITRNDGDFIFNANTIGQTPLVEIYKRCGKTPKDIITGKQSDKDDLIPAYIYCAGNSGKFIFLGAEETEALKPYEEAWYTRVPGRWYGKGVAEKLLMLQVWMNTVVNIRVNRAYVAQLGIFKIRKGAGITPQMISRLASNGAILVNDQQDIEQLVMQEASQASYTDEGTIYNWSERVTAAFEVVTGEGLPASTTATAVGVQSRGAASQFTLIKEGFGMFLQRWLKRHFIPITFKSIKKSEIVRITGDADSLRTFDEGMVNEILAQAIANAPGIVDPQQVEIERQRLLAQMQAKGKDRFINMDKSLNPTDYDVEVYITNEEFDQAVVVDKLINMLQIAPEYRESIVRSALDLMGLDFVKPTPQPVQPQAPGAQNSPQTLQQMITGANTQGNAAKPAYQ